MGTMIRKSCEDRVVHIEDVLHNQECTINGILKRLAALEAAKPAKPTAGSWLPEAELDRLQAKANALDRLREGDHVVLDGERRYLVIEPTTGAQFVPLEELAELRQAAERVSNLIHEYDIERNYRLKAERERDEEKAKAEAAWRNVELFRDAVNRPLPQYTVVDAIVAAKANQAAAETLEKLRTRFRCLMIAYPGTSASGLTPR